MSDDRKAEIERILNCVLEPLELQIKDQSHLHAGHAGAREGKGHFQITIVSEKFDGIGRLARHRMVYDALGTYLDNHIHALKINALSPSER